MRTLSPGWNAGGGGDRCGARDAGARRRRADAPPLSMNAVMSFLVTRPEMPVPFELRDVDAVFLRDLAHERRRA